MFAEYLDAAMRHAVYEQFDEDGSYYGEIPGFDGGFDGVWANESTLEDTTTELRSAMED